MNLLILKVRAAELGEQDCKYFIIFSLRDEKLQAVILHLWMKHNHLQQEFRFEYNAVSNYL